MSTSEFLAGIDVGSTTVKIAVVEPESRELLYADYLRHNAAQAATTRELLQAAHDLFPGVSFRLAVCGSGGSSIAERLGAFFIQEVVANSLAIKELHPETRVAIELGGQDAKVIFFRREETTGALVANDMRMNGSCAGGTGAFIDQVAELLGVRTEEFESLACEGRHVYEISGRCGVFAKTDIQPLLNQGVSKRDLALSAFHAIAKQTIGGLAQGMEICAPVAFEGGPLTFNPTLIRVFQERLALSGAESIVPERPEIIVAYGAALSAEIMYGAKQCGYGGPEALGGGEPGAAGAGECGGNGNEACAEAPGAGGGEAPESASGAAEISPAGSAGGKRFFTSAGEREAFERRYPKLEFHPAEYAPGERVGVYIGIDAGSTTTKFVLLDEDERVVNLFYSGNHGDPLEVTRNALIEMRETYAAQEVELEILGVGTTGYGEGLFATAFGADYHTVETVAHAEAAQKWARDAEHPEGASFVLDIGGQDMKAISLKGGIVTGIVLNEACSAGCGSFIETYAGSLGVPVDQIAPLAFAAENPSRLGSRCTVFMNSSIITEQKNGRTSEDILAGICRSIVENVFTKVVRISNPRDLGERVVAQGGTFKNDAVLRAFEQYLEMPVVRPPFPGEMGAIGIALLTKKQLQMRAEAARRRGELSTGERLGSRFIGLARLEQFSYHKQPGVVCEFCSNNCRRTVVTFAGGRRYITGNRCERGQILGDAGEPQVKRRVAEASRKLQAVPDMMSLHGRLLARSYSDERYHSPGGTKIGLPRALEFWNSLPYWRTVFETLGFEVVVSSPSSYEVFESGLAAVPSDTVCFPAKLAHGHVQDLIRRGVNRIFMPMMIRVPKENKNAVGTAVCPVLQGYPAVIHHSDEPYIRHGVSFDHPCFHWYNEKLRRSQTEEYIREQYRLPKAAVRKAIAAGERALAEFRAALQRHGQETIEALRRNGELGVVLAGRPYHADQLVNHQLARHFTAAGIPVLTLDGLPGLDRADLDGSTMDSYVPFHTRMLAAAAVVARQPELELVQIVSFGCGHDAIISDEMTRLLREQGEKELLVLKLDEGEAVGPLSIRIRSFIETVTARRNAGKNAGLRGASTPPETAPDPFPVKFTRADKTRRVILGPNLSPAFTRVIAAVIEKGGYRFEPLTIAGDRAFELGKQYVHNDICFPAQVNVGEILAHLEREGGPGPGVEGRFAVGLAKNCDACRAGQYAGLARKALDAAGYPDIPIATTGKDTKGMHPGFRLSALFQLRMLWGLAIADRLELMRRRIRPYERSPGDTDAVFRKQLSDLTTAISCSYRAALERLRAAVSAFNDIPISTGTRKPRVGITGEILMKYHPTANGRVERYLESHGMEVAVPGMLDFFRREHAITAELGRRGHIPHAFLSLLLADLGEKVFAIAERRVNSIMREFRYYEPPHSLERLQHHTAGLLDPTFISGEGWLIAGEIAELAEHGVNSFVILNPFGCLPNHISGRGMIKALKKRYPQVQILPLDYDPDTSFANIENRLQMLVIAARALEGREPQSDGSRRRNDATQREGSGYRLS